MEAEAPYNLSSDAADTSTIGRLWRSRGVSLDRNADGTVSLASEHWGGRAMHQVSLADGVVEVRLRITANIASNPWGSAGLIFREDAGTGAAIAVSLAPDSGALWAGWRGPGWPEWHDLQLITGIPLRTGQWYVVKASVCGPSLKAKQWVHGNPEPAWQLIADLPERAPQGPGRVGLFAAKAAADFEALAYGQYTPGPSGGCQH
jgi:hypothetical protein